MMNLRWFIAAVLLILTLTGVPMTAAQVTVKAEHLRGTWELVSTKDLKTGATASGLGDPSTALHWMQLTRSHWLVLTMRRDRSVVRPMDFAKLSPEEKVKTNYARVWNEQHAQVFAARGGTYRLDGDTLYKTPTLALNPAIIGVERAVKILRLDQSTLVGHVGVPFIAPTDTWELTFRRID
jgi:hypothetical protein